MGFGNLCLNDYFEYRRRKWVWRLYWLGDKIIFIDEWGFNLVKKKIECREREVDSISVLNKNEDMMFRTEFVSLER